MCIQARLPPKPAKVIMALEYNNEIEVVEPLAEGRALFNQGRPIRDRLAGRLL